MVTFLSQPDVVQPVYGNLVFQFSTTGATDPTKYKYRYLVDVYTNDGAVASLQITPSSEGWGQVDLAPILMNYTSSQPLNVGCSGTTSLHQSGWGYLNNNMIVYSIMVGEEYSLTPTGVVIAYDGKGGIGQPAVRSSVRYAYNGVKEWFNGKSFDFQPYWLTGSTGYFPQYTSRFLTNSPRTRYTRDTDYVSLAALNWWKETAQENLLINNVARQIYSAVFKFYDVDGNLLSTQRSYNTEDLCGTRPDCNIYDFWFDLPTNFAEQQVVYLQCGVPQLEDYHNITLPVDTKYYSVELEAQNSPATPPTPEIDTFDGCSCHSYTYTNPFFSTDVTFTYLDCTGGTSNILILARGTETWCACQNSNIANVSTEVATDTGPCDPCVCKTYDISETGGFPTIFSYTDCDGSPATGSVDAFSTTRICACEGSVSAPGLSVVLVGACPLPFSGTCTKFGVSWSGGTPYSVQYTGCCGDLQTTIIPPSTSLFVYANDPFPTIPGITAVNLGVFTGYTCPPELPITGLTFSAGTALIGRNVCDNTLQYFSYSGDPISPNSFVQFENTIYEITGQGGGGFIPLIDPYVFTGETSALSAFPCQTFTGGTCQTPVVVSEPFYFYLDGICSKGDRLVWFMNSFGTWDNYNFRQKEETGYSVQKETYQNSPLLYSQGWDSSSYYGWASRRNVWSQQVKKSGVLYTDFMPQAESLWLSKELVQSPSVYIIADNGELEPIVITNSEVIEPNYQINTTQYQLQIEYQSGYDTMRQNQE